uniref:Endonuclease/exonuclease/phosphatase domain-containing protein n=1 Tax=Graphocephala atropunctata TaxID=36148 RepID=A0A1B6KLD1_9HEMI
MTDKIIFANTQGFLNKKEKLNKIVESNKPLVLAAAEHFQSDRADLKGIEGYTLGAAFCRERKERGGVAIFVRNDVDYEERADLNVLCQKKALEVASVEVPSRNLIVTVTYRPPSSSKQKFNSQLGEMLEIFNLEPHKNHVMAGDFNIELSKNTSTGNVLDKNGFKPMLSESTHEHGSCLDNFIVDFDPSKTRVMREKIDKLSDHHPIELILRSSKQKDKKVSLPTQLSSTPRSSTPTKSAFNNRSSNSNPTKFPSSTHYLSTSLDISKSPSIKKCAIPSDGTSKSNVSKEDLRRPVSALFNKKDAIVFFNTTGFKSKMDQINEFANFHQPSVLVVTGHLQTEKKGLEKIKDYRLGSWGYRVAIFVRNELTYNTRSDLDCYHEKNVMNICSLEIPSQNLVITATQKPYKTSRKLFCTKLDGILKELMNESQKNHLIAGGFNFDCLNSKNFEMVYKKDFKFVFSSNELNPCLDNLIVDFDNVMGNVLSNESIQVSNRSPLELAIPS